MGRVPDAVPVGALERLLQGREALGRVIEEELDQLGQELGASEVQEGPGPLFGPPGAGVVGGGGAMDRARAGRGGADRGRRAPTTRGRGGTATVRTIGRPGRRTEAERGESGRDTRGARAPRREGARAPGSVGRRA